MKRFLSSFGLLALVALGFGLGALYMRLNTGPLIPLQDASVPRVAAGSYDVILKRDAGAYLDVAPQGDADTLFIFYPGGLVRPQAYVWLGAALSRLKVRTVIPVMPFDLAVAAPNRADRLLESLGNYERIVIGGHSLGGAMAARYALNHPNAVDGLVIMGAYPAPSDDLSGSDLDVLVLAAENDGLATLAEVRDGLERLPNGTILNVIPGAIHSFFGRYGPQAGDGIPAVVRAEAEAVIRAALARFFS